MKHKQNYYNLKLGENMLIQILITVEILIINLLITHLLSTKKFRNIISFLILGFASVIIVFGFLIIRNDDTPQWVGMLTGIIYIFPLLYVYKESASKMVLIMLFCWTHTLIISAIASSVFLMLFDNNNIIYQLIIQTVLLVASTAIVIKFAKNTFRVILEGYKKSNILLFMALVFALAVFAFLNRYFISNQIVALSLSLIQAIMSIAVFILLSDNIKKSHS
ncbi:MAG: hypothetical protein JEZ05_10955 [Tenericutes bacterium]|nr:hypothetical protein [Mycoplasmatota bacterium]